MTPTLVLVHGCGTTDRFWDELRGALDLPILAPALPGRAPTHGDPLDSAAAGAAWLHAYVVEHRVRPIVVGHSFGGAIAIEYALLDRPELAGLVLVSTGARLRVLPAILDLVAAAARTGEPADVSSWAYRKDTDAAVVARMRAVDREVPPATTACDWQATDRFDRLRDVARIDTRTLVVGGAADHLTPPRYAEYLASTIPGARFELVPDAGHMLPVEQPAAFAALLRSFYAGTPDGARPIAS